MERISEKCSSHCLHMEARAAMKQCAHWILYNKLPLFIRYIEEFQGIVWWVFMSAAFCPLSIPVFLQMYQTVWITGLPQFFSFWRKKESMTNSTPILSALNEACVIASDHFPTFDKNVHNFVKHQKIQKTMDERSMDAVIALMTIERRDFAFIENKFWNAIWKKRKASTTNPEFQVFSVSRYWNLIVCKVYPERDSWAHHGWCTSLLNKTLMLLTRILCQFTIGRQFALNLDIFKPFKNSNASWAQVSFSHSQCLRRT